MFTEAATVSVSIDKDTQQQSMHGNFKFQFIISFLFLTVESDMKILCDKALLNRTLVRLPPTVFYVTTKFDRILHQLS